jgi:hypothetical protein
MNPFRKVFLVFIFMMFFISGCIASSTTTPLSQDIYITEEILPTLEIPAGLTEDEFATLSSLRLVDEFPLYEMHYYADYSHLTPGTSLSTARTYIDKPAWGCSLFAAFADPGSMVAGRNFDWDYSPALLLFTYPDDGYASVSMVDIYYLGFSGERAKGLDEAPIEDITGLLDAPAIPFDGMNEKGLVISMAAVSDGNMKRDPGKPTIDSLTIMREILDHAATTEEAVEIFKQFNIDYGGGPPLHYMVADVNGEAVLVEFFEGEMHVLSNTEAYHMATNFLITQAGEDREGLCWRYDILSEDLVETKGLLNATEAMSLLEDVSAPHTQWSVVYAYNTGEIFVVVDQKYTKVHTFSLEMSIE